MRLLVTRPAPDASRTALTLRERGHTVIVAPLMRIEPVAAEIGDRPWAAILVTSANAALAIAAHQCFPRLRRLPVYAVGRRSGEAISVAGFEAVTSAGGAVDDLALLVTERVPPGARLLYLAGADQAGDLAGKLAQRGYTIDTAVVYRAVAASELPKSAAVALASGLEGVLHFSRRSAEIYLQTAQRAGCLVLALKATQFCLSAAVAEPLERAGAVVKVASQPNEAALIDLIGKA